MLVQGVLYVNVDADGNYDDWGKYMGAGALGLLVLVLATHRHALEAPLLVC